MVNYKYNRTIRRSVAFEMPVKRRVVGGSEVAASEAFTNDGLHPTSRNPGSLNNWQNTNSNWFSISSCNDFGKGSENQEPGKSSIGWFPQVRFLSQHPARCFQQNMPPPPETVTGLGAASKFHVLFSLNGTSRK
ncbi:unnamed protein product [Allacma fusca]|uniref:Uncharacterized protein n=1 Tax=Allacma fusca TaxID=39272 RepID=A0A8J2MC94_9HEXA|nr:unnamed protein product [Allacma fusca]